MLVLAGCAFASGFGIRIADPIIPTLAAEFGTTLAVTSFLVTVFAVFYALGQPLLGPLGDAFGKARLVILCGGVASVLVLACAAAQSFGTLAVLRAASGFVAGGIVPLSVALVSDRASGAVRQAAIGRFLMAPILGQMLGGAVSGVVADAIGWRAVFILTAVLLLAATTITLAVLGLRRRSQPEPFSLRAIAQRYGLLFSNRRSLRIYPLVMVAGVAAYGIFPFIAAIMAARLGTGSSEAGFIIAGFGIGGVLFGLLIDPIIHNIGPARMSVIGGLVAGCALALFAVPMPWMQVALLFTVFGFFFFMLHNSLQAQAIDLAPAARGTAIGLYAFSMFIAQGLGPTVIAPTLTVLPVAAVVVALGAVIVIVGLLARRLIVPPAQ